MKTILTNPSTRLVLVLITGVFLGWLLFRGDRAAKDEHVGDSAHESVWTCSMHPQIRQDGPGSCPICGMDLVPVRQSGGQTGGFVYEMSEEAVALANVQTTIVRLAASDNQIHLSGKIAVNERNRTAITANYSGRIEKLFVDYTGQFVRKGQKVATIYSADVATAQKELLEVAKTRDINPTLYHAAREKLRLWKISESQIDAIETRGDVQMQFDILADITGTVQSRRVSTGDYVDRGGVLFDIVDLSTVWVVLDAYERDLASLRIGQKIAFTLSSIPGKEFLSAIEFIEPFINPQTRTASIRAKVPNPQRLLKPEMFVNARVSSSSSQRGSTSLLIPKASVLWTGRRSVVYIKVPESELPAFEMREVDLGATTGDFQIVVSGLEEGEEVVTNGVFAIDAAAQLSGNYSMMSRPASKRLNVPEEFKVQTTTLVQQYFALKNSLVKSDRAATKLAAEVMLRTLMSIDNELLTGSARSAWMDVEPSLREATNLLAASGTIDEQRKHFSTVSNSTIEIADLFGLTIAVVYVAHCPMAFNNTGADWLSEFEEIKNPYFGDAMLACGEVRDRIRALDSYHEKATSRVSSEAGAHHH